jgi:LysR family transcriptional regulator, regulator of abg operon
MKLHTLQAMVTAVEEGSLRGGAKRLRLSQPALTKAIRDLELELGTSLLVRNRQGVVPTAQGKVLYEHAVRVTRELDAATDKIHQLSGRMTGLLSIGAVPLAVMLLLPETLRTFGREFPDIRLRVSEELYTHQLQRLRKGDVDVAVGGIPGGLPSGEFVIESLLETTMEVVVRRGSPRANATSLQELADARWVYTGATSEEGYARLLFEANGLPAPPIGAIVNSTLALLSIVTTGDYVGLMPRQIAAHPVAAAYLSIVPIREKGLPLTVGAMARSDSARSPAVRHFIAHLHRAAHQVGR